MSQQDLLKRVIARLEETGIAYMITGSVVSSFQGEPRATHDIDIVIAVRAVAEEAASTLKAAFPEPDFFWTKTRPAAQFEQARCPT